VIGWAGGEGRRGVFTVGADCGSGEGAGLESIGAVSPSATGAPQFPQNRVPGCSDAPHFWQSGSALGCSSTSCAEQFLQNRAPALFSAPQLGHFILHPHFGNRRPHRPRRSHLKYRLRRKQAQLLTLGNCLHPRCGATNAYKRNSGGMGGRFAPIPPIFLFSQTYKYSPANFC
jgi:hypothetical protein